MLARAHNMAAQLGRLGNQQQAFRTLDLLTVPIWRAMLFLSSNRTGDTKSPSPLKGLCTEGGDHTLKSATYAVERIQQAKKAGVDALAFLHFGFREQTSQHPTDTRQVSLTCIC